MIVDLLQNSYDEDKGIGKDKTHRLSPSRICKCPRAAFMESYGYKEPLTPKQEAIFSYGNARHEDIQKRFEGRGLVEAEREVWLDDPPILGYVDAIFDGFIVEVKTTNRSLEKLSKPLENHIWQANLYMYMTGIHKAVILYESKDPVDWKEFEISFDQDTHNYLMVKAKYLLNHIQKGKVPMPECYRCFNPYCQDLEIQRGLVK